MDTKRLELLLDAVADYAIYMLDPDGFITSWNAGAERVKGYKAIEIVGQHFSRFFTPEDRANGLPEKSSSGLEPTADTRPRGGAFARMGAGSVPTRSASQFATIKAHSLALPR